jgi:hypothetical protein
MEECERGAMRAQRAAEERERGAMRAQRAAEEPGKSRLEGAPLRALYRRAIAKWGESLEIDCVVEEMAELTAELIRHRRGRGRQAQIAEEIADVRIMLEQLELIYDCAAEVRDYRQKKLERLERRVAE